MSTTEMVVASKGGNNEALGQLLEQYRGFLLMLAHRYLSERLRRRIDPADIVLTTFLEAKRDLNAFRGESPAEFAGWLRGVLKNNVATAVTRHVTTQKRSLKREVMAMRVRRAKIQPPVVGFNSCRAARPVPAGWRFAPKRLSY